MTSRTACRILACASGGHRGDRFRRQPPRGRAARARRPGVLPRSLSGEGGRARPEEWMPARAGLSRRRCVAAHARRGDGRRVPRGGRRDGVGRPPVRPRQPIGNGAPDAGHEGGGRPPARVRLVFGGFRSFPPRSAALGDDRRRAGDRVRTQQAGGRRGRACVPYSVHDRAAAIGLWSARPQSVPPCLPPRQVRLGAGAGRWAPGAFAHPCARPGPRAPGRIGFVPRRRPDVSCRSPGGGDAAPALSGHRPGGRTPGPHPALAAPHRVGPPLRRRHRRGSHGQRHRTASEQGRRALGTRVDVSQRPPRGGYGMGGARRARGGVITDSSLVSGGGMAVTEYHAVVGPRHASDYRTLAWAAAMPVAAVLQYSRPSLVPFLAPLSCYLALSAGIIAHNHNHCPTFGSRRANRVFGIWLSFFYGYPTFAWIPTHNLNHHKFVNGPGDATITWRHTNRHILPVALTYFFVSSYWQSGPIKTYIRKARAQRPALYRQVLLQYGAWVAAAIATLATAIGLHGVRTGLFVWFVASAGPAVFALWTIMLFNYEQHVH